MPLSLKGTAFLSYVISETVLEKQSNNKTDAIFDSKTITIYQFLVMAVPWHIVEHIASFCDIESRRALRIYKKIDMTIYEDLIAPKILYNLKEKDDLLLYKYLVISQNKSYILARRNGDPVVIHIVHGNPVTYSAVGVQRVVLQQCLIS